MTKKRFKLIGDSNLEFLMQDKLELPIYDYDNNKKRLSLKNTLDLLNQLSDENEQLKFKNESFKSRIISLNELIKEFGNKENKVNNEKYKCHICKHLHSDKTLKLYCDINGENFLKKYYDCKNFEDYKNFK